MENYSLMFDHKRLHRIQYHATRSRIRWLWIALIIVLGVLCLNVPTVHMARADSAFDTLYQQAQQSGWTTGTWGTAKYYIDNNDQMYVGGGRLDGNYYSTVGNEHANSVQSINFMDAVQAPQDSSFLFSNASANQDNNALVHINGAENIDMSQVTDMFSMFSRDKALNRLDLSMWNVGQVRDLSYAFYDASNLAELNLSSWATPNANNMSHMFENATLLQNLQITALNNQNADITGMFNMDSHLFWLDLGNDFSVRNAENLVGDPWSSAYDTNGLSRKSEDLDSEMYNPSGGINPGSWVGTYNLDQFNSGVPKPENDAVSSSYLGNRTNAAPTYTDRENDLYIGTGEMQDTISQFMNNDLYYAGESYDQIASGANAVNHVRTINLTHAPLTQAFMYRQDGYSYEINPAIGLFKNSVDVTHINGANNLDVSEGSSVHSAFENDYSLQDLDVSKWNVKGTPVFDHAFKNDYSLGSLNLSGWDTRFGGETDRVTQNEMFANDNDLSELDLGDQTRLKPESDLHAGEWHNYATGEVLSSAQLTDGNSHPGDWVLPTFHRAFQNAQKQGWRTGYWGTAPYYIDPTGKMHVGSGQLQGGLCDVVGGASHIVSDLSFDESVRAPQDSQFLLSTSRMAGDSSILTNVDNLSNLDTSSAQNLASMFANDTALQSLDISSWNTGNADNMSYMFANDSNLTNFNAPGLNTSNVKNLNAMFYDDYQLQDPNIGSWDVRNVTDMDGMFWGDGNLYNLGIVNWDPASLESMDSTFMNDKNLNTMDLSHWDPTNLKNLHSTFVNNESLSGLNLSHWQTPNLQTTESAFNGMRNSDYLNLGNLDTSDTNDMHFVLDGNDNLDHLTLGDRTYLKDIYHMPGAEWQDGSQYLTSQAISDGQAHPGSWQQTQFSHTFQDAQRKGWRTGYWGTAPYYIDDSHQMIVGTGQLHDSLFNVIGSGASHSIQRLSFTEPAQAPQDSSFLLATSGTPNDYTSLNDIEGMNNLDTSQTTNMGSMFANDPSLTHLDISSLNTENNTNMGYMFANDSNLTDFNANGLNTSNVKNLNAMFYNNYQLQNPNIGSWDVRNVTNMDTMFWGDGNLYNLGIVNWDPASLESMDSMFMNDKNLNTMDLSHWDPTNLKNLHSSFVNNASLTQLDLSHWQTPNLQNTESAFNGMHDLNNLNLGNLDTSNTDDMHFMLDGDDNLNYLTLNERTYFKDIIHTPGVEWRNGDQYLNDDQFYNGQSHPGFWQQSQFSHDFQNAQRNGWQTGYWGTAPYYIDNDHHMQVGAGQLSGGLETVIGQGPASYLQSLAFDSNVQAPTDSSFLLSTSSEGLANSSNLTNIDGLGRLDTSQTTNMSNMFSNDNVLDNLDLSHWDTSHVQDLGFTFYNNWDLRNLNVSDWDTTNVRTMYSTFSNMQSITNLNVDDWDTSHVRDMGATFLNDFQLHYFNISDWNTDSLNDMHSMFVNDRSIDYMNLSGWRTEHVTDMESAFNGANNMDHLDLQSANTNDTNDMHFFTSDDPNLDRLTLGNDTHLKDIGYLAGIEWQHDGQFLHTDQLQDGNAHPGFWQQTQLSHDFQDAQRKGWQTGYWGTAPYYIDDTGKMHVGSGQLSGSLYTTIGMDKAKGLQDLSFEEPVTTPQSNDFLLSTSDRPGDTSSLRHIDGLEHMDTSNAQDMGSMFANDTALENTDISSFDTSHVTNMSYMFANDQSLTDLNANGIDTSHVTTLQTAFYDNWSLKNLNVAGWDTSHVQNLDYTFCNDHSLGNLNVDDWDTENVKTMNSTFLNDYALKYIDFSHWNTTDLVNLHSAFVNDSSMDFLNLHGWQTPNLVDAESAFNGMTGLQNLDIGNFDTTNTKDMAYMFDHDKAMTGMTLNEKTYLRDGDHLPGIEWQRDGHILHNEDMNDGQSHPGFWQQTQFSRDYQRAQDNGWLTARWGNVPYYVDDDHNMYVGSGDLLSNLDNNLGDDIARTLRTINLEEPVVAPENSSFLFSPSNLGKTNDNALARINGLDKVDMSHANDIDDIFSSDYALDHLDLSSWDVSHVTQMQFAFYNTFGLTDLNVSNWDTAQVDNMYSIFSGAGQLQDLNVKDWDTDNVYKMQYAFYNDHSLRNLDLSGWHTDHNIDMTDMFQGDAFDTLTLGDRTTLHDNVGLNDGIWQNGIDDLKLHEFTDSNAHPGIWRYIPTQDTDNVVGTEYDDLDDIISQQYHLSDPQRQLDIVKDDKSRDGDHMHAGDYPDIYYSIDHGNGNVVFYRSHLHVIAYTPGDDLQGSDQQSPQQILNDHFGTNVTLEDDKGSSSGQGSMNGDYQVRYRYTDSSGNEQYKISKLHISNYTVASAPYLIVNDDPDAELADPSDIQGRLSRFFGTSPNARLDLTNLGNGAADYALYDGQNSYTGTLRVIPSLSGSLTLSELPGYSDRPFWNTTVLNAFHDIDGIGLTGDTIDDFQNDDRAGVDTLQGNVQPALGQFINAPTIPYHLQVVADAQDANIDSPVNDQQVQSIVHSIDPNAQVVSVTDGTGKDITMSYGALATIPNDSNVTIRLKTMKGYVDLHFAQISELIEPNVDITHDVTTQGGDISNDELQDQIRDKLGEPSLPNFTIDDRHDVSPNVTEFDYHFTKRVRTTGDHIDATTDDVTISGTAYVHSNRDDPNDDPTYTIVQGDNVTQHIENVIGRPIRIVNAPDGVDIDNLAVGTYPVGYQDTDVPNDTVHLATITVIPDYYFSPVMNDNTTDDGTPFRPYDYQHDGSSYKSVIDPTDHGSSTSGNGPDRSQGSSDDGTVDGLHTKDNQPAHFTPNDPYLKNNDKK